MGRPVRVVDGRCDVIAFVNEVLSLLLFTKHDVYLLSMYKRIKELMINRALRPDKKKGAQVCRLRPQCMLLCRCESAQVSIARTRFEDSDRPLHAITIGM